MKNLIYIFMIFPIYCFAQANEVEQDSLEYDYILVEGDSIATNAINLDEVMLLHKLQFNSKEDRKRYLILRRKTIKVYPYAKLAAERLQSLNDRLELLEKKRDKKIYTKRIQKYIEGEFSG